MVPSGDSTKLSNPCSMARAAMMSVAVSLRGLTVKLTSMYFMFVLVFVYGCPLLISRWCRNAQDDNGMFSCKGTYF